jgi:glucose/arabinose dehydrogenase/plastocyanin
MRTKINILVVICCAGWMSLVNLRAATIQIQVGADGLKFTPQDVTVQVGDTVQWNWADNGHSTTSGTPDHPDGLWDSGIQDNGATFSQTFLTAGAFSYFCSPHGSCCGMIGSVTVIEATPTPTPSPTPPLPLIEKGPIKLKFQAVATGLTAPLEVTSPADGSGRLFIVEQTGQIRILQGGVVLPTPFLDAAERLVELMPFYDERGLLGFALHPDFNNAGRPGYHKIYTYTSEPVDGPADFTVPNPNPFDNQSVVAEWQVSASDPNVIDPATRREVLRIDEPQFNHNGGQLAFRPSDRYLYISLGDGGNANDVGDGHNPIKGNGQDRSNVLGKILRIDPLDPALTAGSADHVSHNGKYRVPVTNPFVRLPGAVEEIFLYGLRNPFRFGFDAPLDALIIGDVGQNNIEEIDLGVAGKNYGWNKKEGSFLFNPTDGTILPDPNPDRRLIEPLVEYSHFDGIAVIGGYIYRGSLAPALRGRYVFGDLFGSTGEARLFSTDLSAGTIFEFQPSDPDPLAGVFLKGIGRDDMGELYVLIDTNIGPSGTGGTVLKVVGAANR